MYEISQASGSVGDIINYRAYDADDTWLIDSLAAWPSNHQVQLNDFRQDSGIVLYNDWPNYPWQPTAISVDGVAVDKLPPGHYQIAEQVRKRNGSVSLSLIQPK